MARRVNNFFLVTVAVAALLQSSTAQTTHVVGNALGWMVPSTPNVYSTWAANQTFQVGDILAFNFVTGNHDVAQVTKTAYDACNTTSPITRVTNSPANITLSSAGEHFYICTFPGHCNGGQKLAINVSAASAPAPQPSGSPSPVPAPTPTPTPTSPPTPASTPASPPTSESPAPSTSPTTPSPTGTPPSTTNPTAQSPGSGGASPPAPGNSAKSLHTAGLSATFLAIVVGLLY